MTWRRRSPDARAVCPAGTKPEWFAPVDFYAYGSKYKGAHNSLTTAERVEMATAARQRIATALETENLGDIQRMQFSAWITMFDDYLEWQAGTRERYPMPIGFWVMIYLARGQMPKRPKELFYDPMRIAFGIN